MTEDQLQSSMCEFNSQCEAATRALGRPLLLEP